VLLREKKHDMNEISQMIKFRLNFERQKYNTMIVHLKTNNLSLCLNHEHLKSVLPKNILK
jgi:hypothetical protein